MKYIELVEEREEWPTPLRIVLDLDQLRQRIAMVLALELGHTMASIDPPIYGPNTYRITDAILEAITQGGSHDL